jgi:hypothetical protein
MSPAIILRHEEAKESACRRIRAIKADQENPFGVWIAPYKKIRTLEQNAAYWRLVGLVVDATGHSKPTLHQYFKEQAFGKVVEEVAGKLVEYTPSSSRAERGDFSELIEHVQAFIAEHNIEASA